MFMKFIHRNFFTVFLFILSAAVAAENPFLGDWALTLPGGAAGWLGVQENNGQLEASMMWAAGSVEPVAAVKLEDGQLVITRKRTVQRRVDGQRTRESRTETIRATLDGDAMKLTSVRQRDDGQGEDTSEFTGKRQPPLPPAPDLNAVKYDAPLQLFNGKDLTGWRLTDPHAVNGWSVKDGILVNNPVQEEGKPHKNYGNLRTDQEFGDFNLNVVVRVSKGENSGVYVRGIYEVQVEDSYGKPTDSHNMGAVYSRIKPTLSAEKPAGEWQTMDITFVDRHMTVILNDKKIIDNQPVHGCTGGALWSDVLRPGPIYLQGDHTGIEYRSLVLRPVEK
jgi:3-keto-disaccharide hydrolase